MTKLLYLLSASLGAFASTAFAQSSAGAFPIHGSGSNTFGTAMPAAPPMVAASSSVTMMSMPASTMPAVMPVAPSVMMSMAASMMTKPTTMVMATSKPTTAIAPLATGTIHTVTVGGINNEYIPNFVNAAVGDVIIFSFLEDNHTLTQSTFNTPCMALPGGFDSGFIPNPNRATVPAPSVKMPITTTNPLYFYCKQEDHCVADGMVFSINPSANMSEAAFIARAKSFGTTTMTTTIKPTATAMVSTMMAAPTPSIVAGTGTIINGQCTCACLCGTNAFPPMAGVGAFGGLSGMAPQSALASVAAMGKPT